MTRALVYQTRIQAVQSDSGPELPGAVWPIVPIRFCAGAFTEENIPVMNDTKTCSRKKNCTLFVISITSMRYNGLVGSRAALSLKHARSLKSRRTKRKRFGSVILQASAFRQVALHCDTEKFFFLIGCNFFWKVDTLLHVLKISLLFQSANGGSKPTWFALCWALRLAVIRLEKISLFKTGFFWSRCTLRQKAARVA